MENIKGKINELSTYYTDAYGIAVANGFKGTVAEWLDSLVGKSAYDIAVMQGFKGTEKEWIASLKADADRAEAAVAEAVADAETAATEANASADEAKEAAAEAEASAEQTAKYHGMKYMGSATINVSLHSSYTSPNSYGSEMYDALIIDGTYLDKNNNLVLDMLVDAPDYAREKVPVAGDALRNKIYPLFGCTLVRISIHQPYAMEGGSYWETYRSYSEVATDKDDCGYVWHNTVYDTIEYGYSGNKTLLVEWHEYQSASYTGGYICMLHLSNDLANRLKSIFEMGTNDFYDLGGYIEIEAFK